MKINLDGVEYTVSLDHTIEQIRGMYTTAATEGFKRSDGKVIYLGGKSPVRVALKAIITPVIIPMIRAMYQDSGLLLKPPEKHTDLIAYVINALLDYMKQSESKVYVFLNSELDENSNRSVKSVSTTSTDRPREIESTVDTNGDKNP